MAERRDETRATGDDRLRGPLRDVLALTGDRALPARPFAALVEVPVHATTVRSERPTRRVAMAVAAVLVLLLGVVGLRAVGGREVVTTTVVEPTSERTVAVPLYVPGGMALVSAGVETSVTPAADGTPLVAAVASWERRDATLMISSSPADLVPEPSGDREVALRTGAVAFVVEQGAVTFVSWRQPDGGPSVGIRTTGLALDEVASIANSMWFVTPELWDDLTDRSGFASSEEAQSGYDEWTPPTDLDLDESAVRVVGDLQSGLDLRYRDGNGSVFDRLTARSEWCVASSQAVSEESERWPVVLVTFDPTVTGFMVPDAEGVQRRVEASRHPGLPQMRFAVAETSTLSYGMPYVPCVRGDR